ncbi:MAG: hypothetical protein HYZ28_24610 [Myxococcales bacterium]|nr:hypothetical protein [Myxococcales bacterium]
MARAAEGSTGRLLQLCSAYFSFYVVTGVTVKYFLGSAEKGFPGQNEMEFLAYSTLGGTLVCLLVAVGRGWYRLKSNGSIRLLGLNLPRELLYIVPSGVCTAVVIPTTTLMYTLPISVMVAMVIMRGSVIVISRAVDAIQIRQGLLRKKVYREEDLAVVFALLAVGVNLLWVREGSFEFLSSPAAVGVLGSYVAAYALRIYIMNYYKNTRGKGVPQDNKGFFALEQISATATLAAVAALLYFAPWEVGQLAQFRAAIAAPHPQWPGAVLAGTAYGAVAFFSVFIFMFQGRTATFAGLVNRLTSLVAGTTATLASALLLASKYPKPEDWLSLGFILVAVGFLSLAERKRASELALPSAPPPAPATVGGAPSS